VRDPALWFEFVAAVFDALCKRDPNLRERLRADAAT
jgi:ABC-type Zn uptake system ZnuABC Zn-binding protein ZnuA